MGSISNPIPSGVVACLGGMNSNIRSYNLWKDGQMIVIQAPPLIPPNLDPLFLWSPPAEFTLRFLREYLFGLEHLVRIQSAIWLPVLSPLINSTPCCLPSNLAKPIGVICFLIIREAIISYRKKGRCIKFVLKLGLL
jgi:hypothetical protein